ncbi:MAG TPA: hypothetical protein VMD74_05080 [Candidatus Methylomirabilis sp.]|nr:hypothetical protein [Candidatus Methylomirabilis sp.]
MIYRKNYQSQNSGTALLMTVLILNSIIVIALAAASIIFSGVTMSGTQTKSTKAYFAAEAGAERLLYEYRWANGMGCADTSEANCHFSGFLASGGTYQVDYVTGSNITFISVGNFAGLKRMVQLDFVRLP